jgi:FkbM family methyltransferase
MSKLSITTSDFISHIKNNLPIDKIKTIIEIGSLDGADSLALKKAFPAATVYTIEGLPDNFEQYLKNQTEIRAFNIVICNYIGMVDYHVKDINGLHGIFNRGNEYGNKIIKLPCTTAEKFCEVNDITSIDVLKIDVEGATYEVLESLGNMLTKTKLIHLETETFPFFDGQKLHNEVCNFLLNNNFELLEMTFANITSDGKQSDSVWINKNI